MRSVARTTNYRPILTEAGYRVLDISTGWFANQVFYTTAREALEACREMSKIK